MINNAFVMNLGWLARAAEEYDTWGDNNTWFVIDWQVEASDCDSPNVTELEYTIVTGNYENTYSLDSKSGLIALRNKTRGLHKSPNRLKLSVSDGTHTTFS